MENIRVLFILALVPRMKAVPITPCLERENVGKITDALRKTIAHNIKQCRQAKYPGRGGCKQCAEEFGVSPQQWSPWEGGKRTPDEIRLSQLAEFFGKPVEWMRTDHRPKTPPDRRLRPMWPTQARSNGRTVRTAYSPRLSHPRPTEQRPSPVLPAARCWRHGQQRISAASCG